MNEPNVADLVARRDAAFAEWRACCAKIRALKAKPYPSDGQRIRFYGNYWGTVSAKTRQESFVERDSVGYYTKGVFSAKTRMVQMDNGTIHKFQLRGHRKDGHPGWAADKQPDDCSLAQDLGRGNGMV